jgi:hypothetical protein
MINRLVNLRSFFGFSFKVGPNDDSALRLIGPLLAKMNEQWVTRGYLDMGEFNV